MKQTKIKIFLIISFAIILLNVNFYAQNNLSKKYTELNKQLNLQEGKLDSLNLIFQKKVNIINELKSKKNYDRNELAKLLSGTANLTNEIEETQQEISKINLQLKNTGQELVKFYTKQIDDIKKSSLPEKEKDKQIIKITEKKLLISPKIDVLSFDPKSILLKQKPADSLGQKVYFEYLTYAKNEIKNKIKETAKLKKEIDNIILLKEKSEEFLEESNFDNDVVGYTTSEKTSASNLEPEGSYFDVARGKGNNILTQTNSFSRILNQIKLSDISKEQTYNIDNLTFNGKNNIYNFKKMIVLVERQLKEYLSVINNKLK